MTKEEFEEEITKRERILENAPKGLFEFTEEFQKRLKE
jgi:3-phosphoglycerate kinase